MVDFAFNYPDRYNGGRRSLGERVTPVEGHLKSTSAFVYDAHMHTYVVVCVVVAGNVLLQKQMLH